MKQKTIKKKSSEPKISLRDYDGYKQCPYCGQGLVPFKLGVCICGKQIGDIQYVKNTESFAKNYYSYIGDEPKKTEKLGIEELMDN